MPSTQIDQLKFKRTWLSQKLTISPCFTDWSVFSKLDQNLQSPTWQVKVLWSIANLLVLPKIPKTLPRLLVCFIWSLSISFEQEPKKWPFSRLSEQGRFVVIEIVHALDMTVIWSFWCVVSDWISAINSRSQLFQLCRVAQIYGQAGCSNLENLW